MLADSAAPLKKLPAVTLCYRGFYKMLLLFP